MADKPNLPIVRLPPTSAVAVAGGAGGGGGGGSKKKSKIDPMQAYLRLKAAAQKGDPHAQFELAKLERALVTAQVALTPQPEQEEVLGEEQVLQRVQHMDRMEAAEFIDQHLPYADDLHRKALLQRAQVSSLKDQAQFVRTNPPSLMTGMLGNYQIVTAGGEAIQVCNFTGDDAETMPVGITIAPVEQLVAGAPEGLANTISRPFAIIQFGTRGFSVSFEVDIGTGRQLVVGASSVIVQVAMDPLPAEGAFVAGSMKLAGMLSFHPTIRVTPVTRTRYIDTVLNAKVQTVTVPPFAQRVSWYAQNTAGTTTQLEVQDINHATLYTEEVTVDAGGGGVIQNVELSSDAVFIKVHANGAGAVDIHGRLIFDLNF